MDVLSRLVPASEAYASLPIADAFNWQEASRDLGDGEWYLVAFRSIRRDGADEARLAAFDELAHQEAATAPGFLHYFKGPSAADGSCLSFCLWDSRADARAAAGQPDHVRAVSLIDEMYESYVLEFLRVARVAGGPLTLEPYDGPAPVHGTPAAGLPAHGAVEPLDPHQPIQPALAF
jgi:hypothetical protein